MINYNLNVEIAILFLFVLQILNLILIILLARAVRNTAEASRLNSDAILLVTQLPEQPKQKET